MMNFISKPPVVAGEPAIMDERDVLPSSERKPSGPKRHSKACTTCRQVKLRCDATSRFPAPCSRCETQNRACHFDPAFKRRPMRGALEKVIEEREQLLRLLNRPPDWTLDRSNCQQKSGYNSSSEGGPSAKTCLEEPSGDILRPMPSSSSPNMPIFELYGAVLDPVVAWELIEHFSLHYFYHIPILDLQKPVESLLNDSKLLFWTVAIIAARDHPTHQNYFSLLEKPFLRLLSEQLFRSIRSIYTIQALLLLCTWPLPVTTQPEDPSWEYCGMAVAAATKMNLCKADTRKLPEVSVSSSTDDTTLRLKTWLGCFLVSTRLGGDLALMPPMTPTQQMKMDVVQHIGEDHLPADFLSQLEIQQYSARVAVVLNDQDVYPLRDSLLELLERDLVAVESKMPYPASLPIQIDLLATKLRLYAIPLLSRQNSSATTDYGAYSRVSWYKGLNVAVKLSSVFAENLAQRNLLSFECPPEKPAQAQQIITSFYPKHYFRILVMAGMYLVKLLAVDRDIAPQDKILARDHTTQVYTTLQHLSQRERDEFDRAARLIEMISHYTGDPSLLPNLKEDNDVKPNPSIIEDAVETAGKIRRLHGSVHTPQSSSESQPIGDPVAPEAALRDTTKLPLDLFSSEWDTWFGTGDTIDFFQYVPELVPPANMN